MGATRRAAEFAAGYLCRCENASSLKTLKGLLFEAAEQLNLSYVACGAHVDPEHPPDGAFLFQNYPRDWVERFRAKGYYRVDPVFRHANAAIQPFWWHDEAFLSPLNARQKRMLNEARAFRIADGYTVPLSHDVCWSASISVISESGDIDEWTRIAVSMVGGAIYHRASLLARPPSSLCPQGTLTRRERECLSLKAHGATDDEIASRLDISISTVCRHLDQAKLRLHARSREHAVYRGVETRQIAR
jgi:LuxR family quorum sensing-dependent transcriptional regulator